MKINEKTEQYVYVMSNPSYPEDMLKIGWTRDHPIIRANDLHTSGIPTPFNIEFVIITEEGSKVEKIIHNHLKSYRETTKREFFKISKVELTKILVLDLKLKLTQISEISVSANRKKSNNKKINELKLLYEQLKKEADEFFGNFKKENSELVVKEMNNKRYVQIVSVDRDQTPLLDYDEKRIKRLKNAYYFINRDILKFKKWLDILIDNYKELKDRIGLKLLRSDNKIFKQMILDKHKDLCDIRSEYEWVFQFKTRNM